MALNQINTNGIVPTNVNKALMRQELHGMSTKSVNPFARSLPSKTNLKVADSNDELVDGTNMENTIHDMMSENDAKRCRKDTSDTCEGLGREDKAFRSTENIFRGHKDIDQPREDSGADSYDFTTSTKEHSIAPHANTRNNVNFTSNTKDESHARNNVDITSNTKDQQSHASRNIGENTDKDRDPDENMDLYVGHRKISTIHKAADYIANETSVNDDNNYNETMNKVANTNYFIEELLKRGGGNSYGNIYGEDDLYLKKLFFFYYPPCALLLNNNICTCQLFNGK
uniref:Uncharacterized protein n=1 Tax=Cacopsylla melanoneura TaxID=428564 RepID=A0A8D9BVE4_9HEMI